MKTAVRIAAGTVLILASAAGEANAQVADFGARAGKLFESREYRCAEGRFTGRSVKYGLFAPRSAKPQERFPLLVWMHGYGDNARPLRWIDKMLDDPDHAEKYRFFVLVAECPTDLAWFDQTGNAVAETKRPDDMLAVMTDLLRKMMGERAVDPDRVYLVGISYGATTSWEWAMRDPELFAAVVPLASGGSDESRAAKLARIPIWAFVNRGERKGVEGMVAAVQAAGGNAYLTVADAPDHDAWSAPLQGGILDWILAQRRGPLCWTPPGREPWQWWHVLTMPATFLAILRLAWWMEQRRRRSTSRTSEANQTGLCPGPLPLGREPSESKVEEVKNREGQVNRAMELRFGQG
jgi:poly(3-hydroxybutyrate) depolymerase